MTIRAAFLALISLCISAQAQEIVDTVHLDPKTVESGDADEQIRDVVQRAIDENLQLTVSTPSHWKDMVTEKLEAGAGDQALDLKFRNTFIENVIIRLVSKGSTAASTPASTPARAAPAEPASAAEPQITTDTTSTTEQASEVAEQVMRDNTAAAEEAAREQAREQAEELTRDIGVNENVIDLVEPPKPAVQPAETESSTGAVEESAAAVATDEPAVEAGTPALAENESTISAGQPVSETSTQPAAVTEQADDTATTTPDPEPVAVTDASEAEPAVEQPSAADTSETTADAEVSYSDADIAAARQSLMDRLNNGREIDRSISVSELRQDDVLFVTSGVKAVVRRRGARNRVYWLNGDIDLDSDQLAFVQSGKYNVLTGLNLDDGDFAADEDEPEEEEEAVAVEAEPVPANQTERARMEALYNNGKTIDSTVSVAGLLPDDTLYVGNGEILVFRTKSVRTTKYWLQGELDLEREELSSIGTRKYKVQRVIR